MTALVLFTLFAVGGLASVLVLTDSGLRAVQAWRRINSELRALSGEHSAALVQTAGARTARIGRPTGRPDRCNLTPADWRAAA